MFGPEFAPTNREVMFLFLFIAFGFDTIAKIRIISILSKNV